MTTAEFMDVQRLSVDELRTRFRLAPSRQPSLTALSTDPMINQVAVPLGWRAGLRAPSPSRERGDRRRSALSGMPDAWGPPSSARRSALGSLACSDRPRL